MFRVWDRDWSVCRRRAGLSGALAEFKLHLSRSSTETCVRMYPRIHCCYHTGQRGYQPSLVEKSTCSQHTLPNTHTHTLPNTHTHTSKHTHTDRQPPNSSRSLSVYMHTNRHFSTLHNPIHLSISFPLLFSFYLLFPSLSLSLTHTQTHARTHAHTHTHILCVLVKANALV